MSKMTVCDICVEAFTLKDFQFGSLWYSGSK